MRSILPKSTIDVVVVNDLDIVRYRRALYSQRPVIFSHIGQNYTGTVTSVQAQHEHGPSVWLVRILATPYFDEPPKRARLKWEHRSDGQYVVH